MSATRLRALASAFLLVLTSQAVTGCTTDATTSPSMGAGSIAAPPVKTQAAPNGSPCTAGAQCVSGFCVDDTCCEDACSGGTSDCAACNVTGSEGICSPQPAGTVCRAAASDCDLAETCSGSSLCPANVFKANGSACTSDGNPCTVDQCASGSCTHPAGNAGTECRAAVNECDIAETCSGTSATCPTNGYKSNGAACTDDGNVCTLDECNAGVCGHPAGNSGATCRAAANECDLAELCTGTSTTCPTNVYKGDGTSCSIDSNPCTRDVCSSGTCTHPAGNGGTVCRVAAGPCDVADSCDGLTAACPADAKRPSTDTCRSAATECDAAELCDGVSDACPTDGFFLDDTPCSTDNNVCTADVCKSGVCTHAAGSAGTICRAAASECDQAETCTGSSTSCPADGFKANGTPCSPDSNVCTQDLCSNGACTHPAGNPGSVCRAAAGTCDVEETCTGSSTNCPTDVKRPSSYVCRVQNGNCDVAENCNGGNNCPSDGYSPSTLTCRAASCSGGIATLLSKCPGNGPSCPATQTATCSPYICGASACAATCATQAECSTGYYCDSSVCKQKKANGVVCTTDVSCSNAHCVDGVCCNVACTGQCQACDVTGSLGTCSNVTGAPHGTRSACTSDGSACSGSCNGALATACTYPANTVECRPASCTGNVATLSALCSGAGSCPAVQTQTCSPFQCSGTQCGGNCTIDTECATNSYCSAGICKNKAASGAACAASNQCVSGFCTDGVCCNSACAGQCEACDVTSKVGTCSAVNGAPHGARTACSTDGTACGGTCNGTLTTTCAYPTAQCRAASCTSDIATLGANCDGAGFCPALQTQPCSPYKCGGASCTGNCVLDTDCTNGSMCSGGICVGKLSLGKPCANNDQCVSVHCVDSVCCDTACTGQCEACNVTGSAGTCVPAVGKPYVPRAACTTDGSSCGGACDGVLTTGCSYPGSSMQCRAPSCKNGTAVVAAFCNANGACPAMQVQPCDPFLCGATQCTGDCTLDTDCAPNSYCSAGVCAKKLVQGQKCADDDQCETGSCADGTCCDADCMNQCEACDVTGKEGTCILVTGAPHGGRPACGSSGVCAGSCSGATALACEFPGTAVQCSAPTCSAGLQTGASKCNGAGECAKGPSTSCGGYACSGSTCMTACANQADCASGFDCVGSQCVLAEAGPDADASDDAAAEGGKPDGAADGAAGAAPGSDASEVDAEAGAATSPTSKDSGGCGCATAGRGGASGAALGLLVLFIGARILRGMRRRRAR
jgi:hypothetical protein